MNGIKFEPVLETTDTKNTVLYDALEDLLAYIEDIVEKSMENNFIKPVEPSTHRALNRVQDEMDNAFGPQRVRGTR